MLDAISIDNCRLLIQTLGHSLWQASVVSVLCWLVLRSLPARKAGTRYTVSCGGLVVVVLATLMTAAAVSTSGTASMNVDAATGLQSDAPTGNSHVLLTEQTSVTAARPSDGHAQAEAAPLGHSAASHTVEAAVIESKADDRRSAVTTSEGTTQSNFAWPALAAGVWVFGVLGMMFRLVRTIIALRKLEPCRTLADDAMLSQLRDVILNLSRRMNLRWPVSLVVSDKVSVPGIVGTFWPTLLMPPAMLTGVPIEQLRIVIAHELAHAKRFDFLVNLGQLLVESFLFFNPAVWWLSRQIRIEREACCDAAAVAATGSAVPVARTLLDIVDRLTVSLGTGTASDFAMAAGVQSFVGDESPESTTPMFDRVRRIVTPDQRPHIRVPWYTLLGVITAYGLVGFGLFEGAGVTAQIVQQALSPKERVEKIERLVAAKGELARREGVAPTTGLNRQKPGEAFPEAVLVTGTVRTADGQPLPKGLTVFGTLSGAGYSGAEQFGTLDEATNEFRFSGQTRGHANVRGDTALVSLNIGLPRDSQAATLYAPAAAGPFEVRSGQEIDNIDIVVPVGFPGHVRVLNLDGDPIANAFVSGNFVAVTGQSSANLNPSFTRTDVDGRTTVPLSTADLSWRAMIRAAGYQKSQSDLRLQKDQLAEVVLKRATPVAIVVTSSVDGRPVAGVRAFVTSEHFTRNGHSFGMFNPSPQQSNPQKYEAKSAPLHAYGPSGEDGRLVLDSLADGTRYELLFLTPGYGEVEMTDVNVGQPERKLQIAPALLVTGRIIGDLSGLQRDARTKQRSFQYRPNNRGWFRRVNVEERDGAGHFRLEGLSVGPLTLSLPDRRIQKELTESIHDLVIDLSQPPEPRSVPAPRVVKLPEPQGAQRRVILNLVGAAASAPVTGKFRAGYLTRQQPGSYSSAELDIVDSRVEFDVEVPTQIHWTGRSFTGYSVVGRSAIKVGAGDEPFQFDVPLLAGGAIRGVVRLEDGTLARRFKVDLRPINRKSTYKGADDRVDTLDAPGEFLLTGVPFDEEFKLLISDGRPGTVAAIVSEPLLLSTAEPISNLKFQFEEGRTHTLQLLDELGHPAIGAKVGGWFSPGLGFSRSTGWGVNNDGQVVFQHVAASIPGETIFQVEAAGPFRGQKLKLDWANLPENLTLKRGLAASGQLVDEATGRGLAAARFFLFPTSENPADRRAEFREPVWGETDAKGHFTFECLEPVSYQLNLHGAVPPRVPLRKNNRGILEPDYSDIKDGTFPEWFVRGGKAEPVTIKVKLLPQSPLKPSPASNEEN